MEEKRRRFELPMMATFSIGQDDGAYTAHALDFDIVCVANTEEEACRNLSLAVKTYIEYGLSKGWSDDIHFRAPLRFWDQISPEAPLKQLPPIIIDNVRLLVAGATRSYAVRDEACRAAVPA